MLQTYLTRSLAILSVIALSTHTLQAQMITAHRGASHDAPENTLAAFRLAWEQEADAIEGDFYLTADDEIVCIHDKDTERTAGIKRMVEKSTLPELSSLDVGSWKDAHFKEERIPCFADVYATLPPGKQFVIELKSDSRIVPTLMRQLASLRADAKQLLIISFDADSIAKCKELRPDIRAHWLTGFKKQPDGTVRPTAEAVASTVKRCRADGVGLQGDITIIDQAFIGSLHKLGCREFHVWTIDKPDDAKYFQSLGAMGITTNRPAFIRKAIFAATIAP